MAHAWLGYFNYWAVAILLLIGLYGMLVKPNLIRKLMAMNIMQVAVIFFYISLASKRNALPPILSEGAGVIVSDFVNPLPHALMMTAIVVSVSTTGAALALIIRIYRKYGTISEPELLERLKK